MTPRQAAYNLYRDHCETEEFINQEPAAVKRAEELKRAVDEAEYASLSNVEKMHRDIEAEVEKEAQG